MLDFHKIATDGTGMSTELKFYNSHPDYISTLQQCPQSTPAEIPEIKIEAEEMFYQQIVSIRLL
jgi:hypothetical protein